MSILNSFIHGNAVTEILFEGHNPYATQALEPSVLEGLRAKLSAGESLRTFVAGRVVLSGAGVWALTDRAVLIHEGSAAQVQRLELAQIDRCEAQRGRYGHTVRLFAGGRAWSLYGVDRELALALHQGLADLGVNGQFDARPAYSDVWRRSPTDPQLQAALSQARQHLSAS